jgi:hypothetical protein
LTPTSDVVEELLLNELFTIVMTSVDGQLLTIFNVSPTVKLTSFTAPEPVVIEARSATKSLMEVAEAHDEPVAETDTS